MPKFSKQSKQKLETCHKDLQTIFNYVIKTFDCTIICGHRTLEDQNMAYHKGYSKVQYPDSKHNLFPSMAGDAGPYPIEWRNPDKKQRKKYLKRMTYFAGYVMGIARVLKDRGTISHELVSGLDWDSDTFLKDHKFLDHPHFQLK